MTTLIILIELGIAAAAGGAFVALYAWRSRWRATPMGRHMMVVSAVMAGEAGSLFLLGIGVPVPLWLFAVGYGAMDILLLQRLLLLLRAQRKARSGGRPPCP